MDKTITLPPDREIAAVLPLYTERGDATRLILMDGSEQLLPQTLRSVMKRIARRSCKDVALMRAWSARFTRRSLNNPLPVDVTLVLTPFKARTPRVAGDEVMGCVNPLAVARVETTGIKPLPARFSGQRRPPVKARLVLKSGVNLDSYWSEKTLTGHLKDGQAVQNVLVREMDETVIYFFNHRAQFRNCVGC